MQASEADGVASGGSGRRGAIVACAPAYDGSRSQDARRGRGRKRAGFHAAHIPPLAGN